MAGSGQGEVRTEGQLGREAQRQEPGRCLWKCELLNLMEWEWKKVRKEIAESLEMLTSSWCWLRHRRTCVEIIMFSVPFPPNLEHNHTLGNQTTIW